MQPCSKGSHCVTKHSQPESQDSETPVQWRVNLSVDSNNSKFGVYCDSFYFYFILSNSFVLFSVKVLISDALGPCFPVLHSSFENIGVFRLKAGAQVFFLSSWVWVLHVLFVSTLIWVSDQVSLNWILDPENVGKMTLYLPCRVVARINLDVRGKGTGHDSAKLGTPGKNWREVIGV